MTTSEAIQLLGRIPGRGASRAQVLRAFQAAPVADLGFAQVDTHRALRKGFPEVIFGAGKTPEQVVKIAAKLLEREQRVLVTRVTPEQARALRTKIQAGGPSPDGALRDHREKAAAETARQPSPSFAPARAICRWPRKRR